MNTIKDISGGAMRGHSITVIEYTIAIKESQNKTELNIINFSDVDILFKKLFDF